MDIKNLARNLFPSSSVSKAQESKSTQSKTDADNDKEGNGQASTGGDQKRRKLSQTEIEEAIKYLENLAGVKDHGLKVRAEVNDGITVVLVEDRSGKVVRRIPEADLGALTSNREKKSGHLLNKAL